MEGQGVEPSQAGGLERSEEFRRVWEEACQEIVATSPTPAQFKNQTLPLARIKKIMRLDEDVRMISGEAPVLFAKACELFVLDLTHRAWEVATKNNRRTLLRSDVAEAVQAVEIFDFLVDIVPVIPGSASDATPATDDFEGYASRPAAGPPAAARPAYSPSDGEFAGEYAGDPVHSRGAAPRLADAGATPAALVGGMFGGAGYDAGARSSEAYGALPSLHPLMTPAALPYGRPAPTPPLAQQRYPPYGPVDGYTEAHGAYRPQDPQGPRLAGAHRPGPLVRPPVPPEGAPGGQAVGYGYRLSEAAANGQPQFSHPGYP